MPVTDVATGGTVRVNFIENESAQKLRGGYYTPPDVALFLTRWVLSNRCRRLLEPSCGDGAFLRSIAELKPKKLDSIVACELEATEANLARSLAQTTLQKIKVEINTTEFLAWSLRHVFLPPEFDGILGNPPFLRYQYMDESLQARAEKIFKCFSLPFTKHTNVWVPFVLASMGRLRPGGRLGMVVPAEILHVLHAQPLRQFLLDQCSTIVIIDPEELWFDGTLQGVVLLLAEKAADSRARRGLAVVQETRRNFLSDRHPDWYIEHSEFLPASTLPLKWMRALLTHRERSLLESVSKHSSVRSFQEISGVDVGIVTGANGFFLVPQQIVDQHGLHRWAFPMFGRSQHVRGIIYDSKSHSENVADGLPSSFLWFGDREIGRFPASVQRYIREGEKKGLPGRYKCRIRTPWYNVPSIFPAPVAMLKRSHNFPRLILNPMKALTTDTAYRVLPTGIAAGTMVYCFINSLTVLMTELEGRHYGGGVLEMVPSEIERLLLPLMQPPPGGLRRLDRAFRNGVPSEQILREQDLTVLAPMGLNARDRDSLLAAWWRLRSRRQRKEFKQLDFSDGGRLDDLEEERVGLPNRRAVES